MPRAGARSATGNVVTATVLSAVITTPGFDTGKCRRLFDVRIPEMVLHWFLVTWLP